MTNWIRWFDEVGMADLSSVGGKNASLGEMRRALTPLGIRTPDGFATTADAYRAFLRAADLERVIDDSLRDLEIDQIDALQAAGSRIRSAILAATLPDELISGVADAYQRLQNTYGSNCDVAVRSSATAEDLPDASFAGQQETYLNIHGTAMLVDAVKRCYASLFTDRAIVYRAQHGFDHRQVALSVGVQKMVRSDLACAGVMFSIDTETGFTNAVLVSGAYGLGESVVQGTVNPDEFYVFKPTLAKGFRPILQKQLGTKEFKLVYEEGGSRQTRSIPVSIEDRDRFVLSDDDILTLAGWAILVEEHYSRLRGMPSPMDIEWAKDGRSGELFLVQARPETVHTQRDPLVLERFHLEKRGDVLARGRSVGEKIGQGPARIIRSATDLEQLQPGEVLITEMTDPDWEPVMKRAAAVVTDRGGRTCHAAIVSRELGIPAIVGTGTGTSAIKTGDEVTVSCAEGEEGFVYRGRLPLRVEQTNLANVARPRTRMMMNVANPAEAFSLSFLPNDGVGLARLEFIISTHVRTHPMALLHPERVTDARERREIERLTRGYPDKGQYFVDRLAEGVAMIGAAFWPKDVIVRLSDFKTNEYAGLLGGAAFEPKEENPMLGFRGASRYYDERYREGFALECRAMRKVRDEMGLENVKLMVPFCRTVEEGRRVIAELAANGLVRGERKLEIYVMCEIPSNVILAKEFAEVFDGFSIGSNDLTQLVLGVDRDSELVAHLFDERNEAVKRTIAQVITAAHAAGRKIGICGQAPSDYPEFAQFLVREGIDSLSLNPDSQLKTMLAIVELEKQLTQGARESVSSLDTHPGGAAHQSTGRQRTMNTTLDLKRILVPVDFSGNSRRALDYACGLALKFDAALHLVHVCEVPSMMTPALDAYAIAYADWNQRLGDEAGKQLIEITAALGDVTVTTEVLFGAPASAIVDAAGTNKADLIVMGTHGHGAVMHALMGNVAERVVRTASCPVLTVRERQPLEQRVVAKSKSAGIVASILVAAVMFAPGLVTTATAQIQPTTTGGKVFRTYCASCHGATGHGDGPLATEMRVKPSNLTEMALRNGGRFPTELVLKTIDGRLPIRGHGGPDMPVWGDVFTRSRDAGDAEGVKAVIQSLVEFLDSIQLRRGHEQQ